MYYQMNNTKQLRSHYLKSLWTNRKHRRHITGPLVAKAA